MNKGAKMDLAAAVELESTEYRRFRENGAAASKTKSRLGKALGKDHK
jgi:hypothetical protein